MSQLANLAAEPLCEIIDQLGLNEVIALWICGNTALNWKLSKGKMVRKVEIENSNFGKRFWPHLVHYFDGLEAFHLLHGTEDPAFLVTAKMLLTLPRKLKILVLHNVTSLVAANALFSPSHALFPNLETLDLRWSSELSELQFTLPRTLTCLKLGQYFPPLVSFRLDALPPAIEELHLNIKYLEIPTDQSYMLPGTLKAMYLVVDQHSPFFHLLPPSCEILRYERTEECCWDLEEEDWKDLSDKRLKWLEVYIDGPFEAKYASYLPSTLEVLSLALVRSQGEDWCVQTIENLPKNLKSVSGVWGASITPAIAKVLSKANKELIFS